MKKRIWKIVSAALCMIMVMSQTVFADSIMGGEKEYVSLGADLSQKEKETVLKLLDIDNLEDYDVEYITNLEKVMGYGVMSMPGLVFNEKVVSMGKVLKAADVEKLLERLS